MLQRRVQTGDKSLSDKGRDLLRHTLATIAYRGGKAVRGAPGSFATFQIGGTSRMPVQVLAHVSDLFEWALSLATPVIVKYRDSRTDTRTELEGWIRS